jgi:hypothetical protein
MAREREPVGESGAVPPASTAGGEASIGRFIG